MDYNEFLNAKDIVDKQSGFEPKDINCKLYDFQSAIVRWACKRGRAAIFADCGLGKTPMQLEWAHQVHLHTHQPILILAPLAVSKQTQREGEKFNITVHICESNDDVKNGINITNYEKLHKFDPGSFAGIVLDESSILKSYTGKFRNFIIESFQNTPFKLACTATPAPNDFMELGNHSEFLNVLSRPEMLSLFFIDEKHVCPLQLDTIERCLELWSAKGDVVLDPFSGIGSTVYSAVSMGRYGIGFELKESYWKQSIKNMDFMEAKEKQSDLLSMLE